MTTAEPAAVERAIQALGDPRATPDVAWLGQLTGATEDALLRTLAESERFLAGEAALRANHLAAGRENYAQFRAPLELYTIVRKLRPAHIVETGVSSGVSTYHLLLAVNRNRAGTVHSVDLPTPQAAASLGPNESIVAVPPGRSSGWAMPEIDRRRWDLRLGPSQELLPLLVAELPRIDLFLHDDLHTPEHLAFELDAIRPKLAPGAIVLADNTEWTGEAFPEFAASVGVPMHRRRREDLVGLRMPAGRSTAAPPSRPPQRR